MFASFLMGLVGGQRALTPLAAVSVSAATGRLAEDSSLLRVLAHPAFVAAASTAAIAELAGDKMKTAPDRIVPVGLAARFTTSAIAGAALAPARQRWLGAVVGGSTALAASYIGWQARMACIPRYGQTATGLVEDAMVIAAAVTILQTRSRLPSHPVPA